MADCDGHWSKQEIDAGCFKDARLGRRCTELLRQLGEHMGGSIPFGCQDWVNTKVNCTGFAGRSGGSNSRLRGPRP
ncbi:transposase DNA-binding-containing protein [Agrobacterium tumefaciens]|uniref:transposase DNA-binding-containing protein n=1 Tax=Agrobacterium tumefaciens TaxID=358 RepID=UPI002FD9B805